MAPEPASLWASAAAAVIVLALVVYTLTGGADYGGGVWDLLASGPRKRRQRELVAHAIAPIWEANHVWLILIVVLLFAGFPRAFAAIGTALHPPLALALVGIVLRGASFVFRAYDPLQPDQTVGPWRTVFAVSSTVTPVMLGTSFAAVTTGALAIDPASGLPTGGFVEPWLAPFPIVVGLLVLALDAFLAAVYLVLEADEPALAADFRRKALGAAAAVGGLALGSLVLARSHAPVLFAGLTGSAWSLPFQLVTALVALGTIGAVLRRRDRLARVLAGAQVTLVLCGWAASQWPWLVLPDLSIGGSAAPDAVLRPVVLTLLAGSVLLLPAFAWLYSVFKGAHRA